MPNLTDAYNWAIATCNAPDVGYAGGSAPGAVPASWRDMQPHDGLRYCDCSSFIWYALIAGGWDCVGEYGSWPFTTYTMPSVLPRLGWSLLDIYNDPWQAGDILLFPGDMDQGTGHTEMSYNGNILMGAHNSWLAFADQVSISDYASSAGNPYTQLWRFTDSPSPGGSRVPVWLIKSSLQKKRKEVRRWP